jgi:arsenate reductase
MRRDVLFLCVANSARSQMAEGIARALAPDGIEVHSAGSAPAALNPFAVEALAEIGIDISGQRSKGIDDVPLERIGTIVTLCAEEVCPFVPAEVERLHWPLPDPAAAARGDERAAFASVREQLRARIPELLARIAGP